MGNNLFLPWYLERNKIEKAWGTTRGRGQLVKIYDTCINFKHEALKDKIVGVEECYNQEYEHGTIVAGVLVAENGEYPNIKKDNINEKLLKVAGVAPESKVISSYTSTFNPEVASIRSILRDICKNKTCKKFEKKVRPKEITENIVINLSSVEEQTPELRRQWGTFILQICHSEHILIVGAMGNEPTHINIKNGNSVFVPQSLITICPANIINVAGTNYYDNLSEIKKFKDLPYGKDYTTIYAPAQKINTLFSNTNSVTRDADVKQGTSEAAPIIAATISLLQSCNNNIKASEIKSCLLDHGQKLESLDKIPLVDIASTIDHCCLTTPGESTASFDEL